MAKKYVSQEYSSERGGKNIHEGSHGGRAIARAVTVFFCISIIVGISLISFTVVFFFSDVNGTSMMKTLNAEGNTDSVLVNRYKKPKRGDIIIIRHYNADGSFNSYHIKRLIALGGESIYFEKYRADDNKIHYRIWIGDGTNYTTYDHLYNSLHIDNVDNDNYQNYYAWQEDNWDYHKNTLNNRRGDAPFADKTNHGVSFRHFNADIKWFDNLLGVEQTGRWECKLPKDYIFYMGDNRGGKGTWDDIRKMSIDSTYFGPVPSERLVGTVAEIVHDKTAPQWFVDKLIMFVTFGMVRR